MRAAEFALGLRVRRRNDERSFVRDRQASLGARRVGIVIGLPGKADTATNQAWIQWEGSSRSEYVQIQRLEAMPPAQQPKALGGQWVADDTTFLAPLTNRKP